MSTETHELRLKINAEAAKSGSREFTAALEAVKRSVRDLDRETDGMFSRFAKQRPQFDVTPLKSASTEARTLAQAIDQTGVASDRASKQIQRTNLAAAASLRTSENATQRLILRLQDVGNTSGIDAANERLEVLRRNLAAAATPLDVRQARSDFATPHDAANRSAIAAQESMWATKQEARALDEAARAAATHTEAMQRLLAVHSPLHAASQRYAAALRDIDTLVESNTVSEASASAMRERAAQTYLALGSAADASAAAMKRNSADTMQGVMAGQQLYDVLIMGQMGFQSIGVIAMQQGSQLAAQMNTIKASGGSVFKTLVGGFTSLLNPLSLVVIGGTAVVAMLAQWAFSASEAEDHAKTFKDALDEVAAATERFATAAEAANAPARDIIENYGSASSTIREFLAAVAEGEKMQMLGSVTTSIATLKNEFLELREYSTGNWLEVPESVLTFKDAAVAAGDAAGTLRQALVALSTAKGPQAQYEAALALKRALDEAARANGGLNAEQRVLYDRVVAVGAELGNVIGATEGATSATYAWAGAMSSVRAEIAAILSSLAALGGSVISNAGKRAELTALQAGKTVREAEVARLRFNHEQEMSAREMGAGDGVKGWINRRVIDAERFQFDEGIRLDDELNVARSAARKAESAGGSGGGGGRTKDLESENAATVEVTKSLKDRLSSLNEERFALEALATSQFQTTEASELYAQALVAGKGAVDDQTMAMLRQIDVAAKLNEELKKAARDPVREWMDSVPDWQTAAKDIQASMTETFSTTLADFLKTGEFDATAFADALLAPVFDAIAQKATKELFTALGADNGGLLSGLFSSLGLESVGDPDISAMTTGAGQAGTTIGTAMTTAGQQVAADIGAAMTQGGSQAGSSVQAGLSSGSASVRSAAHTGLATGSNSIRIASTTGGAELGRGVVSGAQQGAPILGAAVAGGAGGGGMFSFESLLGMAIGAFSEGGYTTSPVGSATVPMSAFHNAPHFSEGGLTPGSVPVIAHENEAIVPLSRGRSIPVELAGNGGGGQTVVQNMSFNFPNSNADSFKRSKSQVAADMASAGQRAAQKNR